MMGPVPPHPPRDLKAEFLSACQKACEKGFIGPTALDHLRPLLLLAGEVVAAVDAEYQEILSATKGYKMEFQAPTYDALDALKLKLDRMKRD